MGLIDTHAHLTDSQLLPRIGDVLARCDEAGVELVFSVGTNLANARETLELARRFPRRIRAIVGVHPHSADKADDDDLRHLSEMWRDPLVVAAGEMGLDYHYVFSDRQMQRRVFSEQLRLAGEVDKPVVIHSREAFDDTKDILIQQKYAGRRVVFHCFTGTSAEAAAIEEQGWWISLTGVLTFKKSQWLHEIAARFPIDRLMVETDSPYLSPEPLRNSRPNEPANVVFVAAMLAKLRGLSAGDLAAQTTRNAQRFFGLAAIASDNDTPLS